MHHNRHVAQQQVKHFYLHEQIEQSKQKLKKNIPVLNHAVSGKNPNFDIKKRNFRRKNRVIPFVKAGLFTVRNITVVF